MHYTSDDLKDADYDEDMKLPFKSHNICPVTSMVSFVPGNSTDFTFKLPDPVEETYFSYRDSFLSSTLLSSIWQPPKML